MILCTEIYNLVSKGQTVSKYFAPNYTNDTRCFLLRPHCFYYVPTAYIEYPGTIDITIGKGYLCNPLRTRPVQITIRPNYNTWHQTNVSRSGQNFFIRHYYYDVIIYDKDNIKIDRKIIDTVNCIWYLNCQSPFGVSYNQNPEDLRRFEASAGRSISFIIPPMGRAYVEYHGQCVTLRHGVKCRPAGHGQCPEPPRNYSYFQLIEIKPL